MSPAIVNSHAYSRPAAGASAKASLEYGIIFIYTLILNLTKKFWEELMAYFNLIRHGPHGKRHVQQFFYFCVYIRSRGNVFTEALPSNDRGKNIQTHRLMGGIYEVAVEMGPGATICIQSFIKIGSGIQKLIGRNADRMVTS
jgi:hypothetical protein